MRVLLEGLRRNNEQLKLYTRFGLSVFFSVWSVPLVVVPNRCHCECLPLFGFVVVEDRINVAVVRDRNAVAFPLSASLIDVVAV